jgi:hypothetical protein
VEVVRHISAFGPDQVNEAAESLAKLAWNRWVDKETDIVDDITILIKYF